MSKQIRALLVKPSFHPIGISMDNNLTAFQNMVMGYIETINLNNTYVAIVNEEGKLRNLEANFKTDRDVIVGNAVICRVKGDNFASLKKGDEDEILKLIELL